MESKWKNFKTICEAVLIGSIVLTLITPGSIICVGSGERDYWFVNVTDEVGLSTQNAWHLSVADFNGDGYVDIWGHKGLNIPGDLFFKQFLYLNVPGDDPGDPYSRKFIDYTDESGIRNTREGDEGRFVTGGIFADVDNDHDIDIFNSVYVGEYYDLEEGTNDILLNDGSAHFTFAENSPFHLEPVYNTAGSVFCDYDHDGNVDIFIGNWYGSTGLTIDRLYQGHGNGSFTDVTSDAGLNTIPTAVYAIAAFDWNNDGFVDLFSDPYSHLHGESTAVQWQNNQDGTFTPVHEVTGYDDYRGAGSYKAAFGSMPWDYDNDGDFDFCELFTHGSGDGASGVHSTVVTNDEGVCSWDFWRVDGRASEDPRIDHHGDHYASWTDVDNDGLTDFLLTECAYSNNRIYLFMQAPDNTFSPDTVASGLNPINDANLPSHNVIPMDYDRDGDEDLLVGFADSVTPVQLWRNEIGNQNNWITIELEGGGVPGMSNKCAIGAKIEVTAGGVTYTREVRAGDGQFGPQMPLSLTFGLGSAAIVDSISVYWPNLDQTVTEMHNVPVNQFLLIEERPPVYVDDDFNETTPGWGVDHFASIQDGVDAAMEFGRVFVYNGTYYEKVDVNKTLRLLGESKENTIIDGQFSRSGIIIEAHSVVIDGFTIQNCDPGFKQDAAGIWSTESDDITISNNIMKNNRDYGVLLWNSSDSYIIRNEFRDNLVGVALHWESSYNLISENSFIDSYWDGVQIKWYSDDNVISNNMFETNYYGVQMKFASLNNIVIGNNFTSNEYGIYILDDAYWGSADNNLIYNNFLVNNTQNAYDECTNVWNTSYPLGGNYWDDHPDPVDLFSGPQQDIPGWDGIIDTPYSISGGANQDTYPWLTPDRPLYAYADGPYYGALEIPVQFTGEAAGGIPPYTYHWDFGDGESSDEQNPSHQYTELGTFTATFTVTDSRMIESNDTTLVHIIPHVVHVDDDYDASTPGWQIDHFDIIQDGIDTVLPTGIVYVYNGSYQENIIVNKALDLIGEDTSGTIIDGNYAGDTVVVSANNVLITGFTVQSGDAGIYIINAKHGTVSGNHIIGNARGIHLCNSSDTTITGNMITGNNEYGVYIPSCEGCSTSNYIYLNNFIANTQHAYDECTNWWNHTYPICGNYWDDFIDPPDDFRGETQTTPGPDGVADLGLPAGGLNPYLIPGGSNGDYYAFIHENGWLTAPWYDYDWSYRKTITIDHTQIQEDLIDFPVLIYQDADADLALYAQPDGDDLVFIDNTWGLTQYDHELEYYDDITGALVAWVRIPYLSSNTDTVFHLYYGNPTCANSENPIGVWDNNYVMVHHLEETIGPHQDSTSYYHDGTISGGVTQDAPGKLDGADAFDGINGHITVSDFDVSHITVSAWVKPAEILQFMRMVSKWGGTEDDMSYVLANARTDDKFRFAIYTSGYGIVDAASTYVNDTWYYVVGSYDGFNLKLYVNGVEDYEVIDNPPDGNIQHTPTVVRIGIEGGDGVSHPFHGTLDEIRISDIARSSGWISASYINQNDPTLFMTIGDQQGSNNPPNIPAKPTGRIWGIEDTLYTYTTSTTDPEGDQVYYQWDWGAGPLSDWLGPFDSGAPATAEHAWGNPGRYYIKVRAKDVHGAESDWSEAQLVAMRRFGLPPIDATPFIPD